MSTGSLAISDVFVPNAATGPAPSRPAQTKNTRQFSPAPVDNPPTADAPETTTTDNTFTGAQSEPANQQPQDFRYTLDEKIAPQTPQKPQDSTKSEKQSTDSGVAAQPNSAKPGLARDALAVATGKEQGPAEVLVEPQVADKSAQLFADLKVAQFPLAAGETAEPATTKLSKMVSATSQPNPALKRSAAESLFGAGQSAINQGKIALKTVLPASSGPLTTDTQSGEGKQVDKTLASNKTLIAAKAPLSQQSSKELMAEVLTSGGKTAIVGEKPAVADTSAAAGSGTQKTAQLNGKELMSETLADGDSKAAAAGEKPVVPADQKTTLLNDSFTAVQAKSSDSQAQLVGSGSEKSASVAEKPANPKAGANQHASAAAPELSESADGSGKEHQQPGNSLSGDSVLKNLNPEQVQVSTAQTKDRSDLTSNNSSDSNAGPLEQIPSPSNPQTPVTEQSSASSQPGKPAGSASPSDGFPSVNEQIQESMYSLLRRGDQQITIRLNPPELGRVLIKFQEQQNQITGLLQVDKAQTRAEIQQALPQIIQNLQDSGVQVKRLEVVLTDNQSGQQPFKDQLLQDGWSGRQGSTEADNFNNTSPNKWLADTDGYQRLTELQEVLITDSSVNVLI